MSSLPNNFKSGRSPFGPRVPRSHRLTSQTHTWISANRDWLEREVHALLAALGPFPNLDCPHVPDGEDACEVCQERYRLAVKGWHAKRELKEQARL